MVEKFRLFKIVAIAALLMFYLIANCAALDKAENSCCQLTVICDTGVAIADTAKQYEGVPTIWGGTTPSGFDCSGYTMHVFSKHGIDLPRTSDVQYEVGLPIGKNQLRPGDLVFFETYDVGASHVGIYIGNGQFLHASSSKGVIAVASLDHSYFVERYVGSRRYY